ncbi:hypothetical protein WUBG_10765 [Wuchereria bancrofti]|uniref:Uncharacterized protein n=1 Tax=Wuchereria bancrofti TaxID=6293 RepID=J9ESU4_WUCBA|nr:hypothetical protein WUBG_10765 [Wuchereria bancrofti]
MLNQSLINFRFEFPRPSIASQQPELMQSSFAAPGFPTPSFVDPTHSQPPPAHQRIDQSTTAFQFPYATVVPTAIASENHRVNQQSLRCLQAQSLFYKIKIDV